MSNSLEKMMKVLLVDPKNREELERVLEENFPKVAIKLKEGKIDYEGIYRRMAMEIISHYCIEMQLELTRILNIGTCLDPNNPAYLKFNPDDFISVGDGSPTDWIPPTDYRGD